MAATLTRPATLKPVAFRFDHESHTYWIGDRQIPNVTSMLKATGHVDDTYFTEESRRRGQAVHGLTSDYDLKGLDVDRLVSPFRGYVLAHAEAMKRLKPAWLAVEVPEVHPKFGYGCRCDRVGKIYGAIGTLDEKTGPPSKWHSIQTALQAIAVSWRYGLAPEAMQRFNLYVTEAGRYKVEQHVQKRDFDEAYRIIKRCCGKD